MQGMVEVMDKPVIGVATSHFITSIWSLFSQKVGVVDKENMEQYDLVIFTGGSDISPRLYGEKNTHSYCNIGRDERELEIFTLCLKYGIKMFGVCRGHQLLNALSGGKLVQDLRTFKESHGGYHELIITEPDSVIGGIYTEVNSIHHQGVDKPGINLNITSTYKGVIESVESDNILSVQWHPEFMLDSQAEKLSAYLKGWAMKK